METARQAENMPDSSDPLTYDQMKNQCEALVVGKHQKMSVLQSFKEQQEAIAHTSSGEIEQHTPITSSNNVKISLPFGNIFTATFENVTNYIKLSATDIVEFICIFIMFSIVCSEQDIGFKSVDLFCEWLEE